MSNPAMPKMVKTDLTALLSEDRAGKLSDHTGVPLPFAVELRAMTMLRPKGKRSRAGTRM
jgi:hypothetical protein